MHFSPLWLYQIIEAWHKEQSLKIKSNQVKNKRIVSVVSCNFVKCDYFQKIIIVSVQNH